MEAGQLSWWPCMAGHQQVWMAGSSKAAPHWLGSGAPQTSRAASLPGIRDQATLVVLMLCRHQGQRMCGPA